MDAALGEKVNFKLCILTVLLTPFFPPNMSALNLISGLEYLQNGCKPPIIHRDIKSTNILLNEQFQAKLADFGLSKIIPTEGETHVSTVVAGTPGYLDPE